MKRLHVHVNVDDLDTAVAWYTALFDAAPTVTKFDYAKWMLDDPRVNFAISARGTAMAGLSHLGIQAESADELEGLSTQLRTAEGPLLEEKDARCCYARGDKFWGQDPAGLRWELFHTKEQIDSFGSSVVRPQAEDRSAAASGGCC